MKNNSDPRCFPIEVFSGARSSENRRIYCVHHGACLQYAIDKNWAGMSCEECELRNDKSCQLPSVYEAVPTARGYDPIMDVETDDVVCRLLRGRSFFKHRY